MTIGLIYRSQSINEVDKKIQNAIKEVSKGECIIIGDLNHRHIQCKSLESTGFFSIRDSFLAQHVVEPTRGDNVLDIVLSPQNELVGYVKYINH